MPGKKHAKASSSPQQESDAPMSLRPDQPAYGNAFLAGIAQRECDYTVQPGDTLSAIAKRELGSPKRSGELYRHNKAAVGDDPDHVLQGTKLDVCLEQDPDGVSRNGADVTKMPAVDANAAKADRLLAQTELRKRFDIVAEGAAKERPNQLTKEEFEKMAAMYSDIRMGNSNFQFDSSNSGMTPDDFKTAVMGDFADILTTKTGRELVESLAYTSELDQMMSPNSPDKRTTIGWSPTAKGAQTGPAAGGNYADAVNGVGTHPRVAYQPGVDFNLGGKAAKDGWSHFTSDTTLFHELAHANNARMGSWPASHDPATGNFVPDTVDPADLAHPNDHNVPQEEYNVVGLGGHGNTYTENAYRAERAAVTGTKIPQRTSYIGSGK